MTLDPVTLDDGVTPAPGFPISRSRSPGDLMTMVHAVPAAMPAARKHVRQWLDTHDWPTAGAEDIELAINEAIANVVDHAYPPDAPGTATLHAWVSSDPRTRRCRVVVAVTDRGRWAAYHPDSPARAACGHGLVVMSGRMAELHIQRSAAGTTVIMISATATT